MLNAGKFVFPHGVAFGVCPMRLDEQFHHLQVSPLTGQDQHPAEQAVVAAGAWGKGQGESPPIQLSVRPLTRPLGSSCLTVLLEEEPCAASTQNLMSTRDRLLLLGLEEEEGKR